MSKYVYFGIAILALAGLSYYFYANLKIAETNMQTLQNMITEEHEVIERLESSYQNVLQFQNTISDDLRNLSQEIKSNQEVLVSKTDKLQRVASKKPVLVQNIINKETAKQLKCFENLSRSLSCDEI